MEWNKILTTGVPWQDAQHIELFKRVNDLLHAINKGSGSEDVASLFAFLDEYIVYHFDAEEQAMHGSNYYDTVAHMAEHHRFIEDIARLRREGKAGMPLPELIRKTESVVVDWLVNHIGGMDRYFGDFLGEKKSKAGH